MNEALIDDPENSPPTRPGLLQLLRQPPLFQHLLRGLPAVLAGALVLAVAGAAAFRDPNHVRMRYFDQAARHFNRKDYPAARIGFERIVHEGGDLGTREIRYNLAVCLEVLGETDRAMALIDQLAPDDRVGFAPAHVWQARRLWSGPNRTPPEIRAGEEHLLRALQDSPHASEPSALLGQFYLAAGGAQKALAYLDEAAREQPEMLLPLARAELALDRRVRAQTRAREARQLFKSRAEADLDDFASRLRWVEAEVFLEDFPGAVAALRREASLGRDDRYVKALSQIYTAWADAMGRKPGHDLGERLALLEQGLALDPSNKALLARFSDLIRAGGNEGDRARAALQALVARGRATGPVLFALGLDDWVHGRRAEACLHWDEASRLDPKSPVLANNLACALAEGPTPDLPRALATINLVIALRPDELRYRETRGQILAKLERWKEALPDLKAALVVYPDSPDLHRTLAETYVHLNAPAMAAEHRKRAGAPDATPKPGQSAGPQPRVPPGK